MSAAERDRALIELTEEIVAALRQRLTANTSSTVTSSVVGGLSPEELTELSPAEAVELAEITVVRRKKIYVPDLVRGAGSVLVVGKSFEECLLFGPAIIMMQRVVAGHSRFALYESHQSSFMILEEGSEHFGIIAFDRCAFVDCQLENLVYAGTREQLKFMQQAIGMHEDEILE